MDVPTYNDPAVQEQIGKASFPRDGSVPWDVIATTCRSVSALLQIGSQLFVLISAASRQRDGAMLVILSFAYVFVDWVGRVVGTHNRKFAGY